MAAESLHIYRQLLRSISHAFRGDATMLTAARLEVRSRLEMSRAIKDVAQVTELQAEGAEAAAFLRTSVMQAASNDRGTLEMVVEKDHIGTEIELIEPGMKLPKEKRKKNE